MDYPFACARGPRGLSVANHPVLAGIGIPASTVKIQCKSKEQYPERLGCLRSLDFLSTRIEKKWIKGVAGNQLQS